MILVLGGSGRVGRETVKLLVANGTTKVRVLVRDAAKAAAFTDAAKAAAFTDAAFTGADAAFTAAKARVDGAATGGDGRGVEVVAGEMTDAFTLAQVLKDVERVFTIPPNVRDQENLEHGIYQAARRAGVRHIVKLSTVKADPNSPCYFFQQHARAEAHLKKSGVDFTILRCNSFMQNLLWFAHEIKTTSSFSLPMGTAKTAPVDIRDVAAVAATILTSDAATNEEFQHNMTHNLTGPEKLTFNDIAQKLSAATGKPIEYHDVEPEEFLQTLRRADLPRWYAEAVTASWTVAREGEPIVTNAVATLTNNPPTTFAQFARDHADAFNPDRR